MAPSVVDLTANKRRGVTDGATENALAVDAWSSKSKKVMISNAADTSARRTSLQASWTRNPKGLVMRFKSKNIQNLGKVGQAAATLADADALLDKVSANISWTSALLMQSCVKS